MPSKNDVSYEAQDKLDRKVFAEMIVKMIDWVEGPYVFNINGDWGSGKTFFMGLLREKLQGKCVYINAYENDYYNDPFTSIAAEIASYIKNENPKDDAAKKVIEETKKLGKVLLKQSLPLIINVGAKRLFGERSTTQLADALKGALVDYGTRFIEENEERKMGMKELKNSLEEYIKQTEYKRLVILIDELDRCKPDYSLEMLELLKHLFEVKGLVFVVASATNRLLKLIQNKMGVDEPELYIKKFFNVTIDLPEASKEDFIRYYLDKNVLTSIYNDPSIDIVRNEIVKMCGIESLSLRSIVHCMERFEIELFVNKTFDHPSIYSFLFFLIMQNECDRETVSRMRHWVRNNEVFGIPHSEDYEGFEMFSLPYLIAQTSDYNTFIDWTNSRTCRKNMGSFITAICKEDLSYNGYIFTRNIVTDLIDRFQEKVG